MDDPFAAQCLCLGLLMVAAHLFGRLMLRLRLGQMIGQLLGGVFVGPYFLKAIGLLDRLHLEGYERAFGSFHFAIFAFLGVIAFAIGEELHVDRVRQIGAKPALICLVQALATWVLLTAFAFLAGLHWPVALVMGSIGVATAPAITFILLNQLEIEGRLRNIVANMLVLGDVLEVILFSIFVQVAAKIYRGGAVAPLAIAGEMAREFGLAAMLGLGVFLFLRIAVRRRPLPDDDHAHAATIGPGFVSKLLAAHPTPSVEVLVIVVGAVAIGTGLGLALHTPFLITGVVAGVLVANFHSHALFESLKIDNVMPLLNLVFFALIGANIRLDTFARGHLWLVAGYVAARAVGKILGTRLGCAWTGQDPKVRSCLPLLMLPQAGVAAVEAVYVVAILGDPGRIVADVVLPGIVIFEVAGVLVSEQALLRWRDWTVGESDVLTSRQRALREAAAAEGRGLASLGELMPKGFVGGPLRSGDLEGAVRELAQQLHQRGCVVGPEAVVQRALAREKMGATAIGAGVALPHCKVLGQTRTVCAVGVFEAPLAAPPGPDGVPIDTVVLLVSPMQRPEDHLRALATLARVLADDAARTALKDAIRQGRAQALLG